MKPVMQVKKAISALDDARVERLLDGHDAGGAGRGAARALMLEAERIARERGRSLLTLDTGTDDGAGPLYEKLGFVRAGVIPDYALKPHGSLQGTIIYWKRIGAAPESTQR